MMLQIELQWFLAILFVAFALGVLVCYFGKRKELLMGILDLNDFMNMLRGEAHSPVENLRFLTVHLSEGGPDLWKLIFTSGRPPDVKELNAKNIEKAKAFINGIAEIYEQEQ